MMSIEEIKAELCELFSNDSTDNAFYCSGVKKFQSLTDSDRLEVWKHLTETATLDVAKRVHQYVGDFVLEVFISQQIREEVEIMRRKLCHLNKKLTYTEKTQPSSSDRIKQVQIEINDLEDKIRSKVTGALGFPKSGVL